MKVTHKSQNLCFTNWYSETVREAGEVEGGHCDGTPAAAAVGGGMDDADMDDADIDAGLRTVEGRACGAWPLPADPTCASIARRTFRRVAAADMTVLSVTGGLAVWCWSGVAWLRAPGVSSYQWRYCDLVEVAEQTVVAYDSLADTAEPALLQAGALATPPGPPGRPGRSGGPGR